MNYCEYIRRMKKIYDCSRYENNFYWLIALALEECLKKENEKKEDEKKIVMCGDWRRPGPAPKRKYDNIQGTDFYQPEDNGNKCALDYCSCFKKVINKKGEEKYKRTGIPDLLVVEKNYTYDEPSPAIVHIEFKKPEFTSNEKHMIFNLESYGGFNYDLYYDEIESQLITCNRIIITDGISWVYGVKNDGKINYCNLPYNLKSNDWEKWIEITRSFLNGKDIKEIEKLIISECKDNVEL